MKTIEFGSRKYAVAEHWGELTPDQYQQLIMCPRLPFDGSMQNLDREAAACRVWLGMNAKKWQALVLSNWQWGQLRRKMAWLFNTLPTGKPPINIFFHQGVNYFLPAADFGDTNALELAFANMAYLEFAQPGDEVDLKTEALDRLIATLCRPLRLDLRKFQKSNDWNNDWREPFNEARMLANAKHLASLDLNTKLVVLDYFERTNNEFLKGYGELFGSDRQPRYQDGRGWIMLLKNVAKQGHFGDFDKVCQQPAHLLFAALLDDLLDQEDAKEEAEKQNRP